jgi:hypothetical protein
MEIQHDDIEFIGTLDLPQKSVSKKKTSCSVCGGLEKPKNRQKNIPLPSPSLRDNTDYTTISTFNIFLFVLILLLLFGGIYLMRSNNRRR